MKIIFSPEIIEAAPLGRIGVVRATVVNSPVSPELKQEIETECQRIKSDFELLEINSRPAVAATRALYKRLGKDPNRYRVSSEALCRRIIRGLGLYSIDTLVDLGNLISIASGYAIGVFDADKIEGNSLTLRPGTVDDAYCAIARGPMNIAGLPVYFDAVGGIGSPTSDEERTKITPQTRHVHININAFAPGEMTLEETIEMTVTLLRKYASATDISVTVHNINPGTND